MSRKAKGSRRGRHVRGVGIFIHKSLLEERGGALRLRGSQASADGRLITTDITWAGHRLIVASAYLPNDAADRRSFIQERLSAEQTAAVVAGAHLLIGGDFNRRRRCPRPAAAPAPGRCNSHLLAAAHASENWSCWIPAWEFQREAVPACSRASIDGIQHSPAQWNSGKAMDSSR